MRIDLAGYPSASILDNVNNSNPAYANAAVARCGKVWKRVYRAALANEENNYSACQMASEAYRTAMPPLTTRANCLDFIACVAQGILIHAIAERDSGKLLYAAQVAIAAQEPHKKPQKSAVLRPKSAVSRTSSEAQVEENTGTCPPGE
jgi:hypothetical protein